MRTTGFDAPSRLTPALRRLRPGPPTAPVRSRASHHGLGNQRHAGGGFLQAQRRRIVRGQFRDRPSESLLELIKRARKESDKQAICAWRGPGSSPAAR